MQDKTKLAIYGWVRQNYHHKFPDDICDIIHEFYLIGIDSNILSKIEQLALMDLLLNELKNQQGNEHLKSMDVPLLFRGSEHNFASSKFHDICDNRGPTFVVYHND